jgi:hypothetical protein
MNFNKQEKFNIFSFVESVRDGMESTNKGDSIRLCKRVHAAGEVIKMSFNFLGANEKEREM